MKVDAHPDGYSYYYGRLCALRERVEGRIRRNPRLPGDETAIRQASGDLWMGATPAHFLAEDGTDTVEGGRGNDTVNAVEGQRGIVNCGPGRDRAEFDAGVDTVENCEVKDPFRGAE